MYITKLKKILTWTLVATFFCSSFLTTFSTNIKNVKAADCTQIKLTPTNFYYTVYTQASGKLEVMFRWTPPADPAWANYTACKEYLALGRSKIYYNLAVYDLQGKKYYDQWLRPNQNTVVGSYELGMESHALSENDGLLPNKSYSARLDVIDINISSAKTIEEVEKVPGAILGTARIGQIIFNTDSTTTNGTKTTGECAPNNLTGNFEMYEDYDDHNLHLKWKANTLLSNPKCKDASEGKFTFTVKPINSTQDALIGNPNMTYTYDSGKTSDIKEGTYQVCSVFDPKYKKLEGCASIDMKFFPAGTIGGDVPPEGPAKDASKLGASNACEAQFKCNDGLLSAFTGTICRAQCALIDGISSVLAWVMKEVLYPSLGLEDAAQNIKKPPGPSSGTTTTTPPATPPVDNSIDQGI